MAWQDEIIPMVRILIGDIGEDTQYTDKRLTDLVIAAASLVNSEVSFNQTYTISMKLKTISPDPSSDDNFISLVVLKSACLADQNTVRQKALLEGISAKLGPASLDVSGHLDGFKKLLEVGPCKSYEDLKTKILFGGESLAKSVRAIISPFSHNHFSPMDAQQYINRNRYGEC